MEPTRDVQGTRGWKCRGNGGEVAAHSVEASRNQQKQPQQQSQERNKVLPCQGYQVLRRDLIFREVT